MTDRPTMRRAPQQSRAQQRVATILSAAAALFAEVGYEAATTNAIAERAGTSIGSLYQFFPNKEAILHALARRYHAELSALYDRVLGAESASLPLPALVEAVLAALAAFEQDHPGFKTLLYGSSSREVAALADALRQESARRIEAIIAARAPAVSAQERARHASVSVAIATTLLLLAEQADGETQGKIVADTKRILVAYLRPVMGENEE